MKKKRKGNNPTSQCTERLVGGFVPLPIFYHLQLAAVSKGVSVSAVLQDAISKVLVNEQDYHRKTAICRIAENAYKGWQTHLRKLQDDVRIGNRYFIRKQYEMYRRRTKENLTEKTRISPEDIKTIIKEMDYLLRDNYAKNKTIGPSEVALSENCESERQV